MKKKVIYYFWRLLNFPLRKWDRFRFFYLPNIIMLFKNNLIIGTECIFNQKTRFTGIGKIKIGDKVTFGYKPGGFFYGPGIELQARTKNSIISFGNNISTNNNVSIISSGSITIGDDCLIGQNVSLMDFEAHGIEPDKRRKIGVIGTIEIGKNVWIGNNVLLLKNTKIGDNSIVAAGAIVNKEFPENVIIGGIPARIIRKL